MNCQELTNTISNIKAQISELDSAVGNRNPNEAIRIQADIERLFNTPELSKHIWQLEIITKELLKTQLSEWDSIYKAIELDITLPTIKELIKFLSDKDFIALMKEKEQQDFTQLVIAPLMLKTFVDKIDDKIVGQGGHEKYCTQMWKDMLKDEKQIHYFSTLEAGASKGGYTLDQISANPSDFGILEGCLISFVKPRQNIVKKDEQDGIDTTGRVEIKGGKKAQEYQDLYFSDNDPRYRGEQPMLPQEWLALFTQSFYARYLKDNRKFGTTALHLFDAVTTTWFTSTAIPGREILPYAYWASLDRQLGFSVSHPTDSNGVLAPRSSVRKPNKNQPN